MAAGRSPTFATPRAALARVACHPQAMPVILRNEAEFVGCLTTPADVALALQRPLPDDELMIVATASGRTPPPSSP
jgi:hypothetical protein